MTIQAFIFDNAGNYLGTLEAAEVIGIFRQAQYRYGHCLGKLYKEGNPIGWRFAHCMGSEMCSRVEVLNVEIRSADDEIVGRNT